MLGYVQMNHMSWGWGILMMLGWLALLGLLVGVVLAVVRDRRSAAPREILDRRLAAGDIEIDDYRRTRDAMSDGDTGRPPASPPAPV
jgi:putative membrane protein